jgi:hypothetical protein
MTDQQPEKPRRRTSQEVVLDQLRSVAAKVATLEELHEHKIELAIKAREMDPPVKWREIADALGMSEQAILQLTRRRIQASL